MRRTLVHRLGWLTGTVTCLYVVLRVLDFEPRAVPLALLTTVCLAAAWLVVDVLGDLGPRWRVSTDTTQAEPGHDHRLAAYLRVIEGHLTSNAADAGLRDRLGRLADRRLERHHGLRRDDAAAAGLLGTELRSVLDGAPRRLSPAEIDRHLRRIEEL